MAGVFADDELAVAFYDLGLADTMLGILRLRLAEGMKLQEVKGGELYKRAFVLAKMTKTPLKRVYVVPAGRGHLTNAYGASHTIAVTDNYGKFLTSAQLDFVIGHELGHAKAKHGRKRLLMTDGYWTRESGALFFPSGSCTLPD